MYHCYPTTFHLCQEMIKGKRVNPSYRFYSHPNSSWAIFSNKMARISHFETLYLLNGSSYFNTFFSFEILVVDSSRCSLRYPIIIKPKIWRQSCNVIFPAKMLKQEKKKVTFKKTTILTLIKKFSVIALKLIKIFKFEISAILLLKIT